jgi:phosphatidylglycerophosphatase A
VSKLARLVATGFYTGYAPVAPGTFGTLPGVALAVAVAPLLATHVVLYSLVLVAVSLVAIWAAGAIVVESGHHDPQIVVADEIAGYLLTMAYLPATTANLVAAFLLFRLFDVVKPPPARQAEALPGGLGVVADDLIAGVMANLSLRLLTYWGLIPWASIGG